MAFKEVIKLNKAAKKGGPDHIWLVSLQEDIRTHRDHQVNRRQEGGHM